MSNYVPRFKFSPPRSFTESHIRLFVMEEKAFRETRPQTDARYSSILSLISDKLGVEQLFRGTDSHFIERHEQNTSSDFQQEVKAFLREILLYAYHQS